MKDSIHHPLTLFYKRDTLLGRGRGGSKIVKVNIMTSKDKSLYTRIMSQSDDETGPAGLSHVEPPRPVRIVGRVSASNDPRPCGGRVHPLFVL